MTIEIIEANLDRPEHARAVVEMINAYAMDSMGGGKPLPESVQRELVPGLKRIPTAIVFLAYDGDQPVGIATCFLGYSTFAARPLVNIHDIAVLGKYRGQGVSRLLMDAVEAKARARGCCKVTLEVQETNYRAREVYERAGFKPVQWGTVGGATYFLAKPVGQQQGVEPDPSRRV